MFIICMQSNTDLSKYKNTVNVVCEATAKR